jgi:uncharacterized lipoprotein (TIGR02269 family)
MNVLTWKRGLALLGLLLTACATSTPTVRKDEAPETVSSSWEEAREDPSCVVPLCDEERCAVWRCRDVVEAETHPVLLAQATVVEPLPSLPQVHNASRWWGVPLAAPTRADPVFEIPWHNWRERERLKLKEYRFHCIIRPREPFQKHHIFPRQRVLALWFESRHIDIHAFTIRIPESFHTWLHSGGPEGGQWNEAWRQFMRENRDTASAEDMWRFAGELMNRFGVNGPLVPYYCD